MTDQHPPFEPDVPLTAAQLRERVLSFRDTPVTVELEGVGTIRLRKATGHDMDRLGRVVEQRLSARDFAETLLRNQWEGDAPDPAVLRDLSDPQVLLLLLEWMASLSGAAGDAETLEDAQELIAARYEAWIAPVREMAETVARRMRSMTSSLEGLTNVAESVRGVGDLIGSLATKVAPHLGAINQAIAELSTRVEVTRLRLSIPMPELGRLFSSLPEPEQFRAAFQELRSGHDTLISLGYGFTIDRWAPTFIRQIGRGKVGNRALHAAFLAHTRSDEFAAHLQGVILQSPPMRWRWRDLEPALRAHRQRIYALSIPVFMAQLEGIVTDLLLLHGRAAYRRKKLVQKEEGRIRLGSNGKPVQLTGLDAKLRHSGYQNMEEVKEAAEFILDVLVPQRNAILHGRKSGHGRAKLSVQLALLIWMYAEVVSAAERGQLN